MVGLVKENLIKRNIIDRLRVYEPKLLELIADNAVLSGSFLLQCIIDTEYKKSDIDIYCTIGKAKCMKEILLKEGYVIGDYTWTNDYLQGVKGRCNGEIDMIDLHKEDKHIQLIIPMENSIIQYINKFDFNILRNYYDGNNLVIEDYDSIKNRQINHVNYKHLKFTTTFFKRCVKYTERGFKIRDINDILANNCKNPREAMKLLELYKPVLLEATLEKVCVIEWGTTVELLELQNKNYTQHELNENFLKSVMVSNYKLMEYFLNKGADIHYKDDIALGDAIDNNYFNIIKYLIDSGCNINVEVCKKTF